VELPVYNTAGEVVDKVELSDAVFAVPMNSALVHQAMVRQLANREWGQLRPRRGAWYAEAVASLSSRREPGAQDRELSGRRNSVGAG